MAALDERAPADDPGQAPGRTEPPHPRARRGWLWPALSLLAIEAAGLCLRRIFVTGLVFTDDLGYSQAALDLLSGRIRFVPWPAGQARVGLYAPVAFCYWLFGTSEASSLVFPLLCSLASIALVYALGRLLADERAGLIAAFLWAVFPLDIQAAGALLPDGPITTLTAATVWLFLRGTLRRSRWDRAWLFAATLCWLVAALIKPTAILLLAFAVPYMLWSRRSSRSAIGFLAVSLVALGGVAGYYYQWGGMAAATGGQPVEPFLRALSDTAVDWTQRLLAEPLFAAFTPLAVVATIALLLRPEPRASIALYWAGSLYLSFELGSISPTHYVPISAHLRAGQVLFVLLPFAVVAGIYLRHAASLVVTRFVTVGAALVVATAAWGLTPGTPPLSWVVTGLDPARLPFGLLSGLCLGIAVFGAVLSPMLMSGRSALLSSLTIGSLLTAIGLASLHPAEMAVAQRHDSWYPNLKAVAAFLRDQPAYPVYAQNDVAAARLNAASNFGLGFDFFAPSYRTGRLRIAPPQVSELGPAAIIVVDDEHLRISRPSGWDAGPDYMATPPADWSLVFTAGSVPDHQTRVYRYSPEDASREFEAARRAVQAAPDATNLAALVRAAGGARDYCTAATSWLRLSNTASAVAREFEPVGLLRECLRQRPDVVGPNLLRNGDFRSGTDAWFQSPNAQVDIVIDRDLAPSSRVAHASFTNGNWALLTQNATLEPDTAYVFSMRVRSTAPIVSLYWQDDVGHPFEQNQIYRAWTELVSVFITPRWNGRARSAPFSPALAQGPGDVWMADVRLARFTFATGDK